MGAQREFLELDACECDRRKKLALIAAVAVTLAFESAALYLENPRTAFIGLVIGAGLGLLSWDYKANAARSRWMNQEIVRVLESRQEFLDKN